MDYRKIAAVLNEVIDTHGPLFESASKELTGIEPERAEGFLIHKLAEPVKEVLALQEEFRRSPLPMLNEGASRWSFSANMVGPLLVKMARQAGDSATAIKWLEEAFVVRDAQVLCIMVLHGVLPKERVEFSSGIQLVPFHELPGSTHKSMIIESKFSLSMPLVRSLRQFQDPPAALVGRVSIGPLLVQASDEQDPNENPCLKLFERMDATRLALTAIGPCAPWDEVRWIQFEDQVLERGKHGVGTMFRHLEIQPFMYEPPSDLDLIAAKTAVDGFFGLGGSIRNKVSIALDRLNRAAHRMSSGDKALELAIAFESLLSSKSEREGEHNFKIGLRSALLLGGDLEQRRRVRAIVGAIYSLRSRLVHDGTTSESVQVAAQGQRPAKDVMTEGSALCATLIRRMIALADWPDWATLEVIGGGGPTQ